MINAVQYSKTAVILLNTTNRINTQETDVISLHFALNNIIVIENILLTQISFGLANAIKNYLRFKICVDV